MRHQNLHAQNIESHWLFVMCDEAVETHDVDAGARASKIEGSIRKRWLRATLLIVRPLTKSRPILRIGWNANIWIAICFSHFQYNKHLYQTLVDGVDVNLRMHLPIHLDNPKFRSSERTPKKPHSHTHTVTRLEKKRGTKHRHIDSGMHIWSIHFSTNSIVHNTPVRCTYGSVLAYTLPNKFAYIWSLDDVKHVVSICQWPALNNDSNFCRCIYI